MKNPKSHRGGQRANSGRKPADGKQAMKKFSVAMPVDTFTALEAAPGENRNQKINQAVKGWLSRFGKSQKGY